MKKRCWMMGAVVATAVTGAAQVAQYDAGRLTAGGGLLRREYAPRNDDLRGYARNDVGAGDAEGGGGECGRGAVAHDGGGVV